MEANHSHIFWGCNKLGKYWEEIERNCKFIFGSQIPNTFVDMCQGNMVDIVQKEDMCLAKMILVATKKQ